VDFVLADTADLLDALIGERKRVFLHCVQAQNRTPAVAAAYLVRHHGHDPDAAVDRVRQVLGTRPRSFLLEGVRGLSGPG
jgi:ADP-ribosyl-[dinitrogen reductase] hydrolase